MCRMTAKCIEQLTLTLLVYCVSYSTCWLSVEKTFNGELKPMDPNVCATQNITFTSVLLEEPTVNFSIGFAVKNRRTKGKYVAVDHDKIKKINDTVSQFTMYNVSFGTEDVTELFYFYVRSYYWKTFGNTNGTLQLGKTTASRVYPLPKKVQDFKCIVLNYLSMRCTWNYGKEYGEENMPEVIFQWRIPSFSGSWNNCSDLNIVDRYCCWQDTRAGYFKNTNITVRITLKQKCDINVSSEFRIDTSRIVRPNPLSSISSKVVNSTCIQLLWNTADSEPQHPKEHRIIVSAKGVNVQTIEFVTTRYTERHPHNLTVCNLHPYTEHTFSVSIKPVGMYSGFYSDPRNSVSRTYSDVPSASPEVSEGGYYWSQRDCFGEDQKRSVCVFWKSVKNKHKNGPMKGILGQFTAIDMKGKSVRENWTEDSTYGCSTLLCSTSYNFTIKARNVNGTSERGSTLTIPTFTSAIKSPQFIVESGNRSDVYISWDHRGKSNVKKFIVAWCRNKNGDCEPDHEVYWNNFTSDAKDAVLQINSPQDFLYGVSVITDQSSSGVEWQDCVYLKDRTPEQKPQNVVVSAGPEDNTLVVTWDKLTCKSNEPYIEMYNLQYRKQNGKYHKSLQVSQFGEARIVLRDLEEDQTYLVTVRGVTKEGRYGPESDQKSGVPVNKSLKPAEITGISVAVLVGVIFAGVGLFCVLRRCKKKAQTVIKQAGAITIPDAPDHEIFSSFGRQDSNDSGFDLTPSPDEGVKGNKLSSNPFVLPNDYRFATIGNGELEGTTTDNYALELEKTYPLSESPDMSVLKQDLFCVTSKSTRDSKLALVIPKPVAFDKESESETSFSSGENTVALDTLKGRSNYYVDYRRATPNRIDDTDDELQTEGLLRVIYNETNATHSDNYQTQLKHESHQAYTSFPLGDTQIIFNIPCPAKVLKNNDFSFSDENEFSLTTTDNYQQSSCIASSIVAPTSELFPISSKNILQSDANSQCSSYATITDATRLQRSPVSKDFKQVKSDKNGDPDNYIMNKQSTGLHTISDISTHSNSVITQNPDIFIAQDKSTKVPCTTGTGSISSASSPAILHKTSASLQNNCYVTADHHCFHQITVPTNVSITGNVIPLNNGQQVMQHPCAIQTSNSTVHSQTDCSFCAFEHDTSCSNDCINAEMSSTDFCFPHSNAVQDKFTCNHDLNSININENVPYAHILTGSVPSNAVHSLCSDICIGNVSSLDSNPDSYSTPKSDATYKSADPGYVFSTDGNGVCQLTECRFQANGETVEENKIGEKYASHNE